MTRQLAKQPPRKVAARDSALGRGDLGQSLLLIFPLFIAYEIGLLLAPLGGNGVDFVTRYLYEWMDYDRTKFLVLHLVLAAGFFGFAMYMRKRGMFRARAVPGMLMESAIYALTMGTFIVFVMDRVMGFDLALALSMGPGTAIVASLGAGVHEELVFRLCMMAGGIYVLRAAGVKHTVAVTIALVASSLVFSAAHHVGPSGDDWSATVFTYRALAGVVLGLVFYFRSLAHAVYTHFFYDVYVMLLRGG